MLNVIIGSYDLSEKMYCGNRCLTLFDLNQCHSKSKKFFSSQFLRKKKALVEGKDYYKLDNEEYRKIARSKTCNSKGGYLLTRSGYVKLFGFMAHASDEDFLIEKELLEKYFDAKNTNTLLKTSVFFDDMKVPSQESINPKEEVKAETFDNYLRVLEKFIETQSSLFEMNNKIILEQAKANAEFRDMVKSFISGSSQPPVQTYSFYEPAVILKESPEYSEWKKNISTMAQLIIDLNGKYKTESEILHDAYDLLKKEYGIVFEQEAKEYKLCKGRGPVNTKELVYWMETTKKCYKNLLIGKLNSMYESLKKKSVKV